MPTRRKTVVCGYILDLCVGGAAIAHYTRLVPAVHRVLASMGSLSWPTMEPTVPCFCVVVSSSMGLMLWVLVYAHQQHIRVLQYEADLCSRLSNSLNKIENA